MQYGCIPLGLKRISCSLHHLCTTSLSGAPIALLCRYSCLQAQYGMFVSQFLQSPLGLKRISCSLHHLCNTSLSGAPIALCRYSCLQLASTPLAVAPTARWIHSPTHGNGGQRRFCGIPCACHQTSLGHLSPHLRPPRHLSYHPRHQGHLFGPLHHFPPTPRPSMAKSWPRLVHAAKLFVRPKPETPLPPGA